jgi:hypothetical protein
MEAPTGSPVTAETIAAKTKINTRGFLNLTKKSKSPESLLLSAISLYPYCLSLFAASAEVKPEVLFDHVLSSLITKL